MWNWWRQRAEARKQREIQRAREAIYEAWDHARLAYADALIRGDTRDQNLTHNDLKRALNERLKIGC